MSFIHHSSSMPPTSDSFSYQPAYVAEQPSAPLPKVGQTRCYWALLTSELQFIYLDPVLASHLEEQASVLIGKSLISFVHPDEQASAKHDLGDVLQNRTLHGSVTRVRFSRLSRVRRQLGYTGPPPPFPSASKIALDSNYMAVDIVINYAASNLVLCFIHAIVDLDTDRDNDEENKTEWTNWCGTPWMGNGEVGMVWERLMAWVPTPETTIQPPGQAQQQQYPQVMRVFQILANHSTRPMLLSWPPDPMPPPPSAHQPTSRDFARLVENVQIGSDLPNASDAKTSCTRRYKATQMMPSWPGSEVESIYIPHGTIIFACHKFTPASTRSASAAAPSSLSQTTSTTTATNANMMSYPPPPSAYSPQHPPSHPPYYDQPPPTLPPLSAYASPNPPNPTTSTNPSPTQPSQPYSPQRWPPQGYHHPPSWGSSSPTHGSLPPSVSNLRSAATNSSAAAYNPSSPHAPQPGQWPPPAPGPGGFQENPSGVGVAPGYDAGGRPISPYSGSPYMAGSPAPTNMSTGDMGSNGNMSDGGRDSPNHLGVGMDLVPPPRRRVSPNSSRGEYGDHGFDSSANSSGGGRAGGNRPVGVLECFSCKATTSPEWRKGPSGKKELCNACGLRYARSRAKKEGAGVGNRRRKDRVISGGTTKSRDSATPPVGSRAGGSPSASSSGLYASRRWTGDDIHTGNPGGRPGWAGREEYGGGGSANELYHPHAQSHHHQPYSNPRGGSRYEDGTPSPSPPASSVNFVHYQSGPGAPGPGGGGGSPTAPTGPEPPHPGRSSGGGGGFYSVPSPLSNPPVSASQSASTGHHQLPRLDYVDRLSPMLGGGESPIIGSYGGDGGMSSGGALGGLPSSYERDRQLPPMGPGVGPGGSIGGAGVGMGVARR
ncbi:hypothetical protein PLEOSDRAFT_1113890 [Pleurotus ostreatus PC15]|uniref:GATA-type domain-containing protein n=1 Tax=Pleurotus ostreatus (strain PC15) TaxID=1137138 RepID=A0A067NCH7_PLEO1|nr:hypothetical protein PLEOSDRAFT_1113890 [Pleurotus ostreatus PC15]